MKYSKQLIWYQHLCHDHRVTEITFLSLMWRLTRSFWPVSAGFLFCTAADRLIRQLNECAGVLCLCFKLLMDVWCVDGLLWLISHYVLIKTFTLALSCSKHVPWPKYHWLSLERCLYLQFLIQQLSPARTHFTKMLSGMCYVLHQRPTHSFTNTEKGKLFYM